MDLSFSRFERASVDAALPNGLAVLLAVATGRQAASVTARLHARLALAPAGRHRLAPAHGAFNAAMASTLARWAWT